MGFWEEEVGQLGPFEDLSGAIIGIMLITLLFSSVAYSYEIYDEKRDVLERFEASLDFLHFLKTDAFSVKQGDVIKPSLVDVNEVASYDRVSLNSCWNMEHRWKVVLRDYEGDIIHEVGYGEEGDVIVVFSAVAIRYQDNTTGLGTLEVWVW